MRSIETVLELIHGWPGYVLRARRLPMTQHREHSTWTHIEQEVLDECEKHLLLSFVIFMLLLQSLKHLKHQVCHGVQVLDTCLGFISEALHLYKLHWKMLHFIPHVQDCVDLA